MKKSRISRCIIQIIYLVIVAVFIFLAYRSGNDFSYDIWWFVAYIAIIIFAMIIYTLFRKRCKARILSRHVRRIYKYAYVGAMVAVEAIILGLIFKDKIRYVTDGVLSRSIKGLVSVGANDALLIPFVNFVLIYINAIYIKKIIYNISNSDNLSVFVSIAYIFIPWNMQGMILCNDFLLTLTVVLSTVYSLFRTLDRCTGIGYTAQDIIVLHLTRLRFMCVAIDTFRS